MPCSSRPSRTCGPKWLISSKSWTVRRLLKILVSNDDGILAQGLAVLADVCRTIGQVTVVAPDREQSGASHALTLNRPIRAERTPDGAYQVDGTPTDCV